tara:strand:+ start:121 stop:480 length:360 start_codon:yes stop_codon:yes gene_type:complete
MAYIENGIVYAGNYKEGSSRKRLRKATEQDYNNSSIEKIGGPSIGETAKKAASTAVSTIAGFFSGDNKKKKKKKKKDSIASKIGFNKGGYTGKSRTGHTDYRFNKGGMVTSSTNNMKKK